MTPNKLKTWYVYQLNCDCQSETRIYAYNPKWVIGPRCQGCRKILGDMQVTFLGKFRTTTKQEADKEATKKAMEKCHTLIAEINNKL